MAVYENGTHVIVEAGVQCDNESMASVSTDPLLDVTMNVHIKGDCAGHIHKNESQVRTAHCTAHVHLIPSTSGTHTTHCEDYGCCVEWLCIVSGSASSMGMPRGRGASAETVQAGGLLLKSLDLTLA